MNLLCTCSILMAVLCPGARQSGERPDGFAPVTLRHAPAAATTPAKGRLLIAGRTLRDSNFAESVILLLSYDAHGAFGVILNRPTEVPLASALPDVAELHGRSERIFLGGPVSTNLMLLLFRSPHEPKRSQRVFGDVYASGSLDALRTIIGRKEKTPRWRAFAGYAGWAPGQLEQEIDRGDWHVTPADAAMIFDTPPDEIWPKLIEHFSGEWAQAEPGAESPPTG